jgi:hypothetical protein
LLRGSKRYDIIYMDILSNEFYEANKWTIEFTV